MGVTDPLERLRRQRRERGGVRPGEEESASAVERLRARRNQRTMVAPQQQQGGGNAFTSALGGAARGIASVVEPLQLPKDIADAVAAGALDPDTSITQRLGRLRPLTYAPFGATPPRAATGREILELAGVEDEGAQKWGGIVMDVAADPLLVGAGFRAGGAVARRLGSTRSARQMERLGRGIDRALSPAGVYRGLNVVPGKQWVDQRMGELVGGALDTRVFWNNQEGASTWRELLTTKSESLRAKMPAPVQRLVETEGGVRIRTGESTFGQEAWRSRQMAKRRARDVTERGLSILDEARKGVLGERSEGFLRDGLRILSRRPRPEHLREAPVLVRDSIFSNAYDVAQRVGGAVLSRMDEVGVQGDWFRPVRRVLSEGRRTWKEEATPAQIVQQARERVVQAARKAKFDEHDAVRRFDQFVEGVTVTDAMFGYHLSGARYIQRDFFEALAAGGVNDANVASDMWQEVMRRGMQGEDVNEINTLLGRPLQEFMRDPMDAERGFKTLGDLLQQQQLFRGLDFNEWLKGLQSGHLRRSYGLFQSQSSFEEYVTALKQGRILSSNFFDDAAVDTAFGTEMAGHVREYLEATSRAGRGLVVSQRELAEHVMEGLVRDQGLSRGAALRQAQRGMSEFVRTLNNNGAMERMTAKVEDIASNYRGGQSPFFAAREAEKAALSDVPHTMFTEQKRLTREMLDALGEVVNPAVSLRETAGFVRHQVPWADHMADLYDMARRAGYVRPRRAAQAADDAPRAEVGRQQAGRRPPEEPIMSDDELRAMGFDPADYPTRSQLEKRHLAEEQPHLFDPEADFARATETPDWLGERRNLWGGPHVDPKSHARFQPLPEDAKAFGAFAGQEVHPGLANELYKIMKARNEKQAGGFQRLRSIITGGYLASPNVIAANIFGGIYTSALLGISPTRLMRSMAQTAREFRKSSKDATYVFKDLQDLKRHIAVDDTTLVEANISEGFKRIPEARELDGAGVKRVFQNVADGIQRQLHAPAGQKWAGLDGFQFSENWIKVSAFRTQRRTLAQERGIPLQEFDKPFAQRSNRALQVEQEAAEAARLAVFDYAETGEILDTLRSSGLLLFPGFTYFLSARTMNAALNRPGVVAAADRLSGAVNNMSMDDDQVRAAYALMPEWLRDEQGIVLPWSHRDDERGHHRMSAIPGNQIVPTETFAGNPWGESLATGGIYKPFFETLSAHFVTGDGEAPFSRVYGQRVFEEGLNPAQQLGQSLGFVLNNLAPGVLRKFGSYTPGEGISSGIVPTGLRKMGVVPENVANTSFSIFEFQRKRADRSLWDEVTSGLLRSTTPMATEGPLNQFRTTYQNSRREMTAELEALEQRRDQAVLYGNRELATRWAREIARRRREWGERMKAFADVTRDADFGTER